MICFRAIFMNNYEKMVKHNERYASIKYSNTNFWYIDNQKTMKLDSSKDFKYSGRRLYQYNQDEFFI